MSDEQVGDLVDALQGLSTSPVHEIEVQTGGFVAQLQPSFIYQGVQHHLEVLSGEGRYFEEGETEELLENHFQEEQDTLGDRLNQNMATLNLKKSSWEIDDRFVNGRAIKVVRKPTISKMSHDTMHPALYRNLKGLESLDKLAELLGVPVDWEQKFNAVYEGEESGRRRLLHAMHSLRSAEDEPDLSAKWISLVQTVAVVFGFRTESSYQRRVPAGGLLAISELFVRGKSDASFKSTNGESALNSELKTKLSFPLSAMWYSGSRGPQTMLSLFAHHSPTFLLTQEHWKIFAENKERNEVHTFPMHEEPTESGYIGMTAMQRMGSKSLLKAIYICLLAKCGDFDELAEVSTPQKVMVANRYHNSEERQNATRARISSSAVTVCKRTETSKETAGVVHSRPTIAPAPRYIGDYDEQGNPLYVTVEILSGGEMEELEEAMRDESDSEEVEDFCSLGDEYPLAGQKILHPVCRSVFGALDNNR